MLFHDDYAPARARFREAATRAGFTLTAHDVGVTGPDGGELTLDVAVKANGPIERAVVVSSGTHGVEGYFGSAVQLALLDTDLASWRPAPGEAVVMVHAVNPWGFAHKRRVNEDGVDLNRNFMREGRPFRGAHPLYAQLDGVLNPASPPPRIDLFPATMAPLLARKGFNALKEAIAQGQYDFPQGLFYGGDGPSRSQELLAEVLPPILGEADRVVHFDLHTGSGPWATYVLAVDDAADSPRADRLRRAFGDCVEAFDPDGVLYTIHGALGPWLQEQMPDVTYDCVLAEFGTYTNIEVVTHMRWENRVVRFAASDADLRERAARRMVETFCPADPQWRRTCVDMALTMFRRGMRDQFGLR